MKRLPALLLFFCGFWAPAAPHSFPDGYVDRTVKVEIRNKTVRIEYSVGMNDATAAQLLAQWNSQDGPPVELLDRSTELAPAEEINAQRKKNQPPLPADGSDERPLNQHASRSNETAVLTTGPPSRAQPTTDDDLDEAFENDGELIKELRRMAVSQFAEGLKITCDGNSIEPVVSQDVSPANRHMSVTIGYQFELPTDQPCSLEIHDQNLAQYDGAIRLALKATRSAILTKSNVAPILVRSKRAELADLTVAQRQSACSIAAQVVQVPPPNRPN